MDMAINYGCELFMLTRSYSFMLWVTAAIVYFKFTSVEIMAKKKKRSLVETAVYSMPIIN